MKSTAKPGSKGYLRIAKDPLWIGLAILGGILVLGLVAPLFAPFGETERLPGSVLSAPSSTNWFGTDKNGMDVFSRCLFSIRLDLPIAIGGTLIALVFGGGLGLVAGYFGGWFDEAVTRVADITQAFPILILAMAVVAATGSSIAVVVLIIGVFDTPIYLRLVRVQAAISRQADYVGSAIVLGCSTPRILVRHILPNVLPSLGAQVATRMAWAIKVTASLAFVGVGIGVPTAEWGSMIRVGAGSVAVGQWWPAFFPGLMVVLVTVGLRLAAEGIQTRWTSGTETDQGAKI